MELRAALLILLLTTTAWAGDCVPFQKADEKLGEVACVKGRVLKVSLSANKTAWFLNFCDDYRSCQFAVVTFPRDLKDVGDIRALEGKEIEISGKVKAYQGQTEIILKDRSQLRGAFAKIPKLPKDFDVGRHGSYSAGTFKAPKRTTTKKDTKPTDKTNTTLDDKEE
jgi:DNA/RNA endonuclease YhcR with UshA esterase domain